MTELEDKLKAAGVDVDHARLTEIAFAALKRYPVRTVAERSFATTVLSDAALLVALIGRQEVIQRAAAFVAERAQDMRGGACLKSPEGQSSGDRPSPTDHGGGLSQTASEGHRGVDQSAAPSTGPSGSHAPDESLRKCDPGSAPPVPAGRASHSAVESHGTDDRPASPPPAGTKISRSAATAVARSHSVFNIRLGAEITFGNMTRFDAINLKRKSTAFTHILDRVLTEIRWPDDTTPLKDCCTEDMAKQIYESGYALLGRVPEELRHVR